MKRVMLSVVLVLGLFSTARAGNGSDTVMITMTLNKFGNVKISLKGSGMATVDWGNGKTTQRFSSGVTVFTHYYFNKSNRTITIYGQDITYLNCKGNQITSLDVSGNPALKSLQCSKNRLTDLDVSKNTALTLLSCSKNQLTNLDVSRNNVLTNLVCDGNQLNTLCVSKNTALMFLNCRNNQLSAEALNNLFGTLNSAMVEGKILYIRNNSGTYTCNQKVATDKEWKIDTSFI